jgi:protein SCO1/2
VPAFALVDQARQPVTERDLEGHLTLVTFVYTRCPLPEFCPLVTQRLRDVQDEIAREAALTARVRVLSVTLDPEFDTPDVLAAYGRAHGADPARWRYATGSASEIATLTRAFAVYTERNGATRDPTLATALVGADGRVLDIWRGNGWKIAEVAGALRHAQAAR